MAKLLTSGVIKDKRCVILAGTGPVGHRAAVMMANEGGNVALTSRQQTRANQACTEIKEHFDVEIEPIAALDNETRAKSIEGAQVVFATGAAGAELLLPEHWQDNQSIEMMADALRLKDVEIKQFGSDVAIIGYCK